MFTFIPELILLIQLSEAIHFTELAAGYSGQIYDIASFTCPPEYHQVRERTVPLREPAAFHFRRLTVCGSHAPTRHTALRSWCRHLCRRGNGL